MYLSLEWVSSSTAVALLLVFLKMSTCNKTGWLESNMPHKLDKTLRSFIDGHIEKFMAKLWPIFDAAMHHS